jgi:DNA-binding NarL/FixJ family response regulator
VNDKEILAVEEAAARLETATPSTDFTNLHSAVAAAVTNGKSIREVAEAAHLTVLEVLDAADAVTYRGPVAVLD